MAALANLVLTILLAFIIPLLQLATTNVPSDAPTTASTAPTSATPILTTAPPTFTIQPIDATPKTPAITPTRPTHWCATTPAPPAPRFVKVIREDESTSATNCRTIVITSSSL